MRDHAVWGGQVESIDGYRVGDRVVLRPESAGVRRSIGSAVKGRVVKLWEDGAAYVEQDNGEILACGVSTFVHKLALASREDAPARRSARG